MDEWNKFKNKKALGEFPQEVSENIKAPESAPVDSKVIDEINKLKEDYDLIKKQLKAKKINMNVDQRISGRTEKVTFACRSEFKQELKDWAYREKCYQIEILEKAFEDYKKKRAGGKKSDNE